MPFAKTDWERVQEAASALWKDEVWNSVLPVVPGTASIERAQLDNLVTILEMAGMDKASEALSNGYSIEAGERIKEFLESRNIQWKGFLDRLTLGEIVLLSMKNMEIASFDEEMFIKDVDTGNPKSPHYGSFFHEDNAKTMRKNRNDIVIEFGGGTIRKTVKEVYMRSLGVAVDQSGNPISETYEFIARDVVESDEAKDANKYEDESSNAPSDIKYKFNFGKTIIENEVSADGGNDLVDDIKDLKPIELPATGGGIIT